MRITDLWNPIFDLWSWAWNWTLPISGIDIKPLQLCIGVFLVEFILDICFPSPHDMSGDENGGQ